MKWKSLLLFLLLFATIAFAIKTSTQHALVEIIWSDGKHSYFNYTITDESRYYEINVAEGEVNLSVYLSNYSGNKFSVIYDWVNLNISGIKWHNFTLPPFPEDSIKIYGYIYDNKTLQPIENATIKIYFENGEWYGNNFTKSNSLGYYEIFSPKGKIHVEIFAEGYYEKMEDFFLLSDFEKNYYLEPYPPENMVIKGYVKNIYNIPIENAKVNIFLLDFSYNKYTLTDINGYYETNLFEGNYTMLITANGYLSKYIFPFHLYGIKWLNITMQFYPSNNAWIEGYVYDRALQPIQNANVSIYGTLMKLSLNEMDFDNFIRYAITNGDGYFNASVPALQQTFIPFQQSTINSILTRAEGYFENLTTFVFEVIEPGETKHYDFQLDEIPPENCKIRGYVHVGIYAPPICDLEANPTEGNAPLNVNFTIMAYDTDGYIAEWYFDANNDGIYEYNGIDSPPSNLFYTYDSPGTYIAKLVVIDNMGNEASDSVTVNVYGENIPPIINITNPKDGSVVYGTVEISGIAYDLDGEIQTVEIRIDNGSWITPGIMIAPGFISWSYMWNTIYFDNGLYTIFARAYDGINYTITSINVTVNNPTIVYVDDDFNSSIPGWQYDHFSNIQDGINAVVEGGTVYIYNGVYENILINKSLNLIGENPFIERISIYNENILIENCTINGINAENCNNISIFECHIYGPFIINSSNNISIGRNLIKHGYLSINKSHYMEIYENYIENNSYGITSSFSSFICIFKNNISSNNYGIYLHSCNHISIFYNNFINNTIQAYDNNNNTWDNGYPYGGNYWNDHDEAIEGAYDNNSDGIVDKPYNVGNSKDRYPLIKPFSPFKIYNLTIIINPENAGYVVLEPSGRIYRENTVVMANAISNNSYVFVHWLINGNIYEENPIYIIMDSNKTVVANFSKNNPPDTILISFPPPLINYSTVTFKWTGTDDFTSPDNLLFSYKLDSNWSPWDKTKNKTYNLQDGTYLFMVRAKDEQGLIDETPASIQFTIDTIPPETSANISGKIGKNGWYISNVSISLHSTSNKTYYRINGEEWKEYKNEIMISNEGENILEYYSIDKAGNKENKKSLTIKIDKTSPITNYSIDPSSPNGKNGWYVSNVTIKLFSSDGESGVEKIMYKVDDGNWMEYKKPVKINNGVHKIKFYSIDYAGNEEDINEINIKIDKNKPIFSIKKPEENYLYVFDRKLLPLPFSTIIIGKITIEVYADDNTSGIKEIRFYVDNELKYNDTEAPYEWTFKARFIIRKYWLKVEAVDNAGNTTSKEIRVWIL